MALMESEQTKTLNIAMQTYLKSRAALIAEDRSLRDDHNPELLGKLGSLEDLGKAENIIRRIRKEEEITIWAEETEAVPHIFPG
jgi:hypothetical protein